MNKKEIGTNAGAIWHILCDAAKLDYPTLKSRAGLKERDFAAALGWLARENQIEFYEQTDGLFISLKCNVYFG